jgi:signal transduction histidine kinase
MESAESIVRMGRVRRRGRKRRRSLIAFVRSSLYAKFAIFFLVIWWAFNSTAYTMIMNILISNDTKRMGDLGGYIFVNNAIIGAVVMLVALRGIVKPIKKLSDASREVANGKFDVAVEIKNRDEIGRLAADFNDMVSEIGSLDKMRREFVSNVSHEFRTPITSIRGFAKLISENAGDADAVREYGETIARESERLIALSSNLLRLSELDTRAIRTESKFSLDEQIRQVVLALAPLWEQKGIEFDIELPEATCTGDEELLRQVWLNLIENAIKFSPDGGVVKVEMEIAAGGGIAGGSARVRIADGGAGIAKEDLPRIFDRFYKGGSSSGNGLGLAIVQKIVEFSGGTVWAESEAGSGAAFTVALPLKRERARERAPTLHRHSQ